MIAVSILRLLSNAIVQWDCRLNSDTNNKAILVNCIYAWSLCEMVNCSWPSPRRNTRQRNWTSNSVSYLQSV